MKNTRDIQEFLANPRDYNKLYLGYKNLTEAECTELFVILENNTTLTYLDLDSNQIGAKGAEALAKALHGNTTLMELNLDSNQIGAKGAEALAKALHGNTTLTELNLALNKIGDSGAAALAKALHSNTTLTNLGLSLNKIGDEGAAALAEGLHGNTALTELDLAYNQIEVDGAAALANGLHGNTTLTKLFLYNNLIGGIAALTTALASTKLKELSLGADVDAFLSNAQDAHEKVSKEVIEVLKPHIHPLTLDVMVVGYIGHLLDMQSELAGDAPLDDALQE